MVHLVISTILVLTSWLESIYLNGFHSLHISCPTLWCFSDWCSCFLARPVLQDARPGPLPSSLLPSTNRCHLHGGRISGVRPHGPPRCCTPLLRHNVLWGWQRVWNQQGEGKLVEGKYEDTNVTLKLINFRAYFIIFFKMSF